MKIGFSNMIYMVCNGVGVSRVDPLIRAKIIFKIGRVFYVIAGKKRKFE